MTSPPIMDASPSNSGAIRSDHADSALRHLPSHVRLWLVAGIALTLDLWTKAWIFHNLGPSEVRAMVPGVIDFRRSLNDGAVFGSFTGYTGLFMIASVFALGVVFYLFSNSTRHQRGFHIALALILAGALGNLYDRAFVIADVVRIQTPTGEHTAIIGKVVEQTDDGRIRVGHWPEGSDATVFSTDSVEVRTQGVVRDFIKFVPRFPKWMLKLGGRDVWPWVFNVADAALVCGVILLFLGTIVGHWHGRTTADS